jgi:cell division protein FtsI (penicillin-binding protein 3)
VAEQPDHSWRKTLKRRLVVATGALLCWSLAIEARLVHLQIVQHEWLLDEADGQQSDKVELTAKRGDILDRNGRPLALTVDHDSAFAVPLEVTSADAMSTVERFCKAVGDCSKDERDTYVKRLIARDKRDRAKAFVYLRRRLRPDQADRVAQLNLKGVYFQKEPLRYYPNRELAAHLLGWVGTDNKGMAGVERRHDAIIGGRAGEAILQIDGGRRPFNRAEKPPTPGASVVLTIDQHIQHVAERALAEGVKWSGAKGGSAIVLDPITGELLAMANYPTFNPNNLGGSKPSSWVNRAVENIYEPGSTFKTVTAAAALEEQIATPSDLIHTSPGYIRLKGRVIDEAKGHNYGTLTFEDVIVKSSNVGAVKIGFALGPDRLSKYVSLFGFGSKSSDSDFPAESRGLWNGSSLSQGAIASVSMGYEVGVTPLQMAAAVSVVANRGELIRPRLIKGWIRDGVYTPVPKQVVRRVISEGTATQLTGIMEEVVSRGTAKVAQIEGFTIAGKTGTAAKVLPGGGYSTSEYNVSFVGFVPSREPMFTILVVIDTPTRVSAYGGTVAAPVFQKIASAALLQRGVPASLNRPAPLLIAHRDPLQQRISGPAQPEVVTVADSSGVPPTFPDLVGMNARDAVHALVRLGVRPRVSGFGDVVKQQPAPGTPLDLHPSANLWLDRRPPPEPAPGEAQPLATTGGISRGRP